MHTCRTAAGGGAGISRVIGRPVAGRTPPLRDGVRLAYYVKGEGQAVLLIMGLGVGAWGWDLQVPALARRFRVISYDHRGTGASDVPAGGYGLDELTSDVLALLDSLGVERVHVVGVSMGGFIAQKLALDHPDRVERLVLCATTCGGPRAVRPDPGLWADFTGLWRLPRDKAQEVCLRAYFGPRFPREDPRAANLVVKRHLELLAPPETLLAHARACRTFDESARVGGIRAPTLIAHGSDDVLLPVENARLLVSFIPGARLVIYEGAGHGFIIERAGEFNRDLIAFLAGSL